MAKRETINGLAAALLRSKGEILHTTPYHWLVRIPDGDVQCLGVWDEQTQTLELLDGPAMLAAVLVSRSRTITVTARVEGGEAAAAAIAKAAEIARTIMNNKLVGPCRRKLYDAHCQARRQRDGLIRVIADPYLTDAEAASLRDQLDVALHVPAPAAVTDPPSKL